MRKKISCATSLVVFSLAMVACQEGKMIPPEPEKIPITHDIAWTVVHSNSYGRFLQTIQFDPAGMFGMAYVMGGVGSFSNDGGKTWKDFDIRLSGTFIYENLRLFSSQSAAITAIERGTRQLFFGVTQDGGKTWTFKEFEHSARYIYFPTVALPSADRFYLSGKDFRTIPLKYLWVSSNSGNSWVQVTMPGYLIDISAANNETVVAVLAQDSTASTTSSLWQSIDGGMSWNLTYSDTALFFHKVHFATSQYGIAIAAHKLSDIKSNRQALFRTTDGGRTWTFSSELTTTWSSTYYTSASVKFASAPVWLVEVSYRSSEGGGELNYDYYRTEDNGATWTFLENIRGVSYHVAFAPPDWKIGIRGNQMTQDGGRTWQTKSWLITQAFFTSPYEAFAVMDSRILRGTAP